MLSLTTFGILHVQIIFVVLSKQEVYKYLPKQTVGRGFAYRSRLPYEPCKNQNEGEFVKNIYACDKFFYCGPDETTIPVDCPHGMIFNDKEKICDFPSNYQCVPQEEEEDNIKATTSTKKHSVISTTTFPTTDSTTNNDNPCPRDDADFLIFLPHQNTCHQYYICYHGKPLLQNCIRELHWNKKTERCDFPENAKCTIENRPNFSSTELSNVDAVNRCPFRGEQIFAHPEKCNNFIYCINGYPTLQQCPYFHYFDIQSKSCIWQTMSRCSVKKSITNME